MTSDIHPHWRSVGGNVPDPRDDGSAGQPADARNGDSFWPMDPELSGTPPLRSRVTVCV